MRRSWSTISRSASSTPPSKAARDTNYEDEVLSCALREDIDCALAGLDEREAEVLRLYFSLPNEPPLTLEHIGARFLLTRERVRQIKELALSKLRHPRFYARLRVHADF